MPETENSEFGLNLTSHSSSGSVSGVPIKKRLFRSHYNYSRSLEPDLPLQDCQISTTRPSGLELEYAVSENSSDLILHSDISGQSSSVSHNSSTASTHENISHASSNEYGLENARSSGRGTSTAGLTVDDKSFGSSLMDNSKLMSFHVPPASLVSEGDIGKRSCISDKSMHLANLEWQLTSSSDLKNYGHNLIKQEVSETCSLGVPLAPQNSSTKTNANVGPVRTNRLHLDLNIPALPLDAIVDESIAGNSMHKLNGIDKYQKKIQVFPVQAIPHGISWTHHHDLRLSNLDKPADKHKEFVLGLDLQLRPPSISELSVKWRTIAPDLSLSLKGNVSNDSSGAIKSEPYVDHHQIDTLNFHLGGSKPIGVRHVIPEPCIGNLPDQTTKITCPNHQKPEARRVVKMELPEQSSEECFNKSADGTPTPTVQFENSKPSHHHLEVPQSVIGEPLDLNAATVFNGHLEVDDSVINENKTTVQSTSMTSAFVVNPSSEELSKDREALDSTSNLRHVEGNATKSVVGPLISDSKEDSIGTVIPEDNCLATDPFHESLQPIANDGVSEGSAEMDCSDGEYCTSLKLIAKDIPHQLDSMEKSLRDEQVQESVNLCSKIQEHCDDNQPPCHGPHDPSVITREQDLADGSNVGQNKDYELKDLVTQGIIEASCMEGQKAGNKMASNLIAAADVALRMPSDLDNNSKQLQVSVGVTSCNVNLFGDKNDTNCSLTTELHGPPGVRVQMLSRNIKLAQSPQKATKKDEGRSIRSKESSSSKVVKDVASSQKVNANEGDVFTKKPVSIDMESDASGLAAHQTDDTGKTDQIVKVSSSGTNKISLGKTTSVIDRLVFAQTEREGLFDKSHRSETSHSRVSRGERCNDRPLRYKGIDQQDRPLRYGSNDQQDRPVQKRRYDMMNSGRDSNHFNAYHPNSGPRYSTKLNDSRGYRFARHSNGHEIPWRTAADDYVGSGSRIIRRHMDDESSHRSRFPYRRHSPRYIRPHDGGSVVAQIPEASRDVSPRGNIGRPIPDAMQDCEGMRCLPNKMIDPLLYADPYMYYEDGEMHSTWRERSFSPTQRGPPLYLPSGHRPYQCPQPRRSPDILEEHPELARHRSPPVDPLRSPPHLCFPDYTMNRNGLPHSRLPSGMREMNPTREVDLRGPGRGGPRNRRRFDLSVQEENTEEDYFRSLHFTQLPRHPEDEFFERRNFNFDDKHAYLQSYENNHPVSDDGEEHVPYPVDVGPPRPIRFCPKREGFSDRGSLRDPNIPSIKNQPRSTSNKLRNQEEREDLRNRGPPAWQNNGFNDGRLKRRRD